MIDLRNLNSIGVGEITIGGRDSQYDGVWVVDVVQD